MDIGTPVLHTDDEDNTYAGQIVGRDHEMRPVWRDKAGKVIYNPDGTLADKARVKTDVVTTERVETGLFAVLGTYRDGHQKFLVVAPEDLQPVPAFESVPVFSHAPADVPEAPAPAPAPVVAAPVAAPAPVVATVGPAVLNALMSNPDVVAAVAAAMAKQGA